MATSTPPPVSRLISATTSCSLKLSTTSAPMRLANSSRFGTQSTPMTSDAPASRAPAVAQRPIGPCANTATASPIRTPPLSAAENPVDMMSGQRSTSSSVRPSGILARLACAFGDEDVFGLAAVDGVAEPPAADGLVTVAAVAALRSVARQARAALAAGRDGTDDHAISRAIADHPGPELPRCAHRFVTDDEPVSHRVFALQDVHVGSADGRHACLEERLTRSGLGASEPRGSEILPFRRTRQLASSSCESPICHGLIRQGSARARRRKHSFAWAWRMLDAFSAASFGKVRCARASRERTLRARIEVFRNATPSDALMCRLEHDRPSTCLGLSICRGGIRVDGGEIHVRDLPGRGSVFTVELLSIADLPTAD